MQVGFHVFKYQIDVSVIFCLQDIQQSDNILMVVDLLQEHDFAKRSLSICCVLERVKDLFQGNDIAGLLVDRFPNNPICPLSELLLYFVLS